MSDFQSKDFEQRNNLKKAGAFHSKNFSKFLRSDVFQFLYRDLGFNSDLTLLGSYKIIVVYEYSFS